MIDRRYLSHFDWLNLALLLILCCLSSFLVLSATYRPDQPFSPFFNKQIFGLASGLLIYFICAGIDYRTCMRWGVPAYLFLIGLLSFTLIKGSIGLGAQRWVSIAGIKFQPSELAKLLFPPTAVAIALHEQLRPRYRFGLPLLLLAISAILILKQPDLGTALLVASSGITLLWVIGMPTRALLGLMAIGLIGAPMAWKHLHPYQRQRVLVLLGQGDLQKERYQIEQSIIAIGSGGLTGKGYLEGTQNKLQFLPEGRTDFIFAVFCEEFGFIGALALLCIYALLFIRAFAVLHTIKNRITVWLGVGVLLPLLYATVINTGMVMGLLPIVGIPLPLLSYGITHVWIACASLGCYQSIATRRFFLSNTTP
jgi:rod shape determining protein RodA